MRMSSIIVYHGFRPVRPRQCRRIREGRKEDDENTYGELYTVGIATVLIRKALKCFVN